MLYYTIFLHILYENRQKINKIEFLFLFNNELREDKMENYSLPFIILYMKCYYPSHPRINTGLEVFETFGEYCLKV